MTPADLTDADRLEDAMAEAIQLLIPVLGLPPRDRPAILPRTQASPDHVLVDPDRLPAGAHVAACKALELLGLGLAVLDPSLSPHVHISVEDGLAALTPEPAPSGHDSPEHG